MNTLANFKFLFLEFYQRGSIMNHNILVFSTNNQEYMYDIYDGNKKYDFLSDLFSKKNTVFLIYVFRSRPNGVKFVPLGRTSFSP